jgi:hypothetical protein
VRRYGARVANSDATDRALGADIGEGSELSLAARLEGSGPWTSRSPAPGAS